MIGIASDYQAAIYKEYRLEFLAGEYSYSATNREGEVCAFINARFLPWDSARLGVRCGRIDLLWAESEQRMINLVEGLHQVVERMRQDGVQFCDCRISIPSYRLIYMVEEMGFRLTDVLNIYLSTEAPLVEAAGANFRFQIVSNATLTKDQIAQAVGFGKGAFLFSRLYQDERIEIEKSHRFYQDLLETFLNDQTSYVELALDSAGKVAGFVIGRFINAGQGVNRSCLWLIAIDPVLRGKGLGRTLLASFLTGMHKRYDSVEIGTQVNNLSANALYCHAGLRLVANVASFHRWFS